MLPFFFLIKKYKHGKVCKDKCSSLYYLPSHHVGWDEGVNNVSKSYNSIENGLYIKSHFIKWGPGKWWFRFEISWNVRQVFSFFLKKIQKRNCWKHEILCQVNYLPNHILMSGWYNYKNLKDTEKSVKWSNHSHLTNDSGWETVWLWM